MPIHDYDGHRRLAEATSIKVATGENGYTTAHFRTLLDHNGASVLNVDVTICPGYDTALEVADMARSSGVTIAPHGCQELQLPLAAGVAHGEFLEVLPHGGRPPPGRDVPSKAGTRRRRLGHRARPPRRGLRAQHGSARPLQGRLTPG